MELVEHRLLRAPLIDRVDFAPLIRAAVIILIAASIAVPYIPMRGPLSLDDLFPLIAVILGLVALSFSRGRVHFDATLIGFVILAILGVISSAVNADSIRDFARLAGRSSGRFVFFLSMIVAFRTLLSKEGWAR